jgi:hypothetical protein
MGSAHYESVPVLTVRYGWSSIVRQISCWNVWNYRWLVMNVARRLVILSTSPIDKRSVHRFVSIFTVEGQSTCALWNVVPSERIKPGSSLTMHGSARLIEPELVEGSIFARLGALYRYLWGVCSHKNWWPTTVFLPRRSPCLLPDEISRFRSGKARQDRQPCSSTLDLRISLSRLRENR